MMRYYEPIKIYANIVNNSGKLSEKMEKCHSK